VKKKRIRKFTLTFPVTRCNGVQVWEVEARSAKDAMNEFAHGAAKLIAEEVEVTSVGEPEIQEEEP